MLGEKRETLPALVAAAAGSPPQPAPRAAESALVADILRAVAKEYRAADAKNKERNMHGRRGIDGMQLVRLLASRGRGARAGLTTFLARARHCAFCPSSTCFRGYRALGAT